MIQGSTGVLRRSLLGQALAGLAMVSPVAAVAQGRSPRSTPPQPAAAATQALAAAAAARPVPDRLSVLKLVWSTIAAVDQANKTGNYSVLRDLGDAGFQSANTAAGLAAIFTTLRDRHVDLLDTLIVEPVYDFPPTMVAPDVLRVRGTFPLRPTPIRFDLLFRWAAGWRILGLAVAPGPS